jgi:tripartite-type tricarboxylate transporter receptor subunit TctC
MIAKIAKRIFASSIVVVVLAAISLTGAAAQLSPRPITIVVPYSPGTGPDILARIIGEELRSRWNQPVVVDNQSGAIGNIATYAASRAA